VQHFGEVTDAKVIQDRETGRSRGFGSHRGKADTKGKEHQPKEGPTAGIVKGQTLADGKDGHIQALDKQGQAQQHHREATNEGSRIIREVLDEKGLEDNHDDQGRCQIARGFIKHFPDSMDEG